MSFLYQTLSERVDAWRSENYPCDGYPAIWEVLEYASAIAVKIIDMLGEELLFTSTV